MGRESESGREERRGWEGGKIEYVDGGKYKMHECDIGRPCEKVRAKREVRENATPNCVYGINIYLFC